MRREPCIQLRLPDFRGSTNTPEMVLYVYIDEKGEIEDFYVGGS